MTKKELDRLREVRNTAQKRFEEAIRELYPIHSAISWEIGGNEHHGVVLDHGGNERLKVRNNKTEREYWITAYQV